MEDIYTRSPFGRELEISCRAFTYRAGGRSKQDRSTVFRVKRVSAAEKTPLCSAATRNRCNKDSWSITSAGISQCDEKDRPRKFQKRATSPSPRGKIGTVLKFSLNSSPSIDKSARFLNKINERIVLWLEKVRGFSARDNAAWIYDFGRFESCFIPTCCSFDIHICTNDLLEVRVRFSFGVKSNTNGYSITSKIGAF